MTSTNKPTIMIRFFSVMMSFLFLSWNSAVAQNVEMADEFRAEGKIYVVVAIVLIVLLGMIAYLFFLDRKVGKIEKMIDRKVNSK
jgi:hypothetical protein